MGATVFNRLYQDLLWKINYCRNKLFRLVLTQFIPTLALGGGIKGNRYWTALHFCSVPLSVQAYEGLCMWLRVYRDVFFSASRARLKRNTVVQAKWQWSSALIFFEYVKTMHLVSQNFWRGKNNQCRSQRVRGPQFPPNFYTFTLSPPLPLIRWKR